MAGYKSTFGENVDYAYSRGVTDLTSKVQTGVSQFANAGKGIAAFANQAKTAVSSLNSLSKSMKDIKSEMEGVSDPKKLRALTKEFKAAQKAAEHFKKQLIQLPFNKLEAGLGGLTKGLISVNANILKMGFDFLIGSIKRVYELQERWTHAIGGFNMKMGGMTAGMKGATKAATQWSSTIRGLTNGSIEEGIQLFGEFTMAMGRTVTAGDKFTKFGIQLARGFGLGGAGAGQLSKVFENIGMSADDAAESMKTSIKAANAANIPVNMLAEDLAKSSTYMARFGKEGQKTLIQGAAWARKYDIALDQLKQSVEGFDMFDEAARSASKLNTAFGTMVNSMDLMMEDDPAKRLEMIRQQMLSQGQTYDKLTPKQRRYFSETMKLTDEQTAALLDANNAGESYADFQAKAEKKQKQELAAKAMMQKMLVKTAQTMYAFGAAFDRVTVAIAKAIRPLLEVLGLAKKGDKNFKGFGSVMESITKTVIEFFESLAGNDKWMSFMRELGHDLQRAGTGLKAFVMEGRAADLVGDIAKGMKSFYITVRDLAIKAVPMFRPILDVFLTLSKYIKELAIAWAGMKIFNMAGGVGGLGKIAEMVGGGSKTNGATMKGAGRMASVGGGAAIGGALGGTGGAIGGAIGGLLGPIGAAAGAAIGYSIKKLYDYFSKDEALDQARADAVKAEFETAMAAKKQAASLEGISLMQKRAAKRQSDADGILDRARKGKITINEQDVALLKERVEGLRGFGKKTDLVEKAFSALNTQGRVTKDMLNALTEAQEDQRVKFEALSKSTEAVIAAEERKLDFAMDEIQLSGIKNQQAKNDIEIQTLQKRKEELGSKFDIGDLGSKKQVKILEEMKKIDESLGKVNTKKADLAFALAKKQASTGEKHYFLDLKKAAFEDAGFKAFAAKNEFKNEDGTPDMVRAMNVWMNNNPNEFRRAIGGSEVDNDTESKLRTLMPRMATGGIVTRPTRALIGEAGPEAVIPLSRMRENLAGGSSSGGETIVTQIAEVTLDGQKVGRALVRSSIRGRN